MAENLSLWTRKVAEDSGLKVWYETVTSSTNDIAKSERGFDLYLAGHQTSGHGRGTHRWIDRGQGCNLLSSWVFSLSSPPQHVTGPLMGLAVYRALHAVWPRLPWSLKAPNDILLAGKKTGGILLEAVTQGTSHRLIVGLGFNVKDHPEEVAESTCLERFLTAPVDRSAWERWISVLLGELKTACERCRHSHLGPKDNGDLLAALNANPNLARPYDRIDSQGNLYAGGEQTPWQNILE